MFFPPPILLLEKKLGWLNTGKKKNCSRDNNLPPTNFAARNSRSQIACLECLWVWRSEHIMAFDCCQPVAERRSIVVASSMSMTFNKWIRPELFKTGTW